MHVHDFDETRKRNDSPVKFTLDGVVDCGRSRRRFQYRRLQTVERQGDVMGQTNLVEFGSYSVEDAKRERAELEAEGTKGEFRTLKPGKHRLRIVPPKPGEPVFTVIHNHYLKFTGNDGKEKTIVVTCPRMATKGKRKCPICEKADELRSNGNPMDRDAGYDMMAKRKVFMQVVDRKAPEKGVQIQPITKTVHEKLIEYGEDEDDPCDFSHPIEGYDIIISRKGSGRDDTKYSCKIVTKPSPLAGSQEKPDIEKINEIILAQKDMARHKSLPSDEDILKALSGENPYTRKNRQLSSGNAKPEEFSDDDDDEDVVDGEIIDDDDDDDMPDGF